MYKWQSKFLCNEFDIVRMLKLFGIDYLTSESCGYSMRLLCDVNQTGVELLSSFFGGIELLADNWNPGATKSITLPRSIFGELYIFAVLQSNPGSVVFTVTDNWKHTSYRMFDISVSQNDINEELEYMRSKLGYSVGRIYSGVNRNRHEFTGRVE